jgi:hypothetical protein
MKKRIAIWITVALALVIAICGLFVVLRPRISDALRQRVEQTLSEQFESRVEFSGFWVSLRPRPTITVTNLTLRHHGRTDIPPLIQVAELSMSLHWSVLRGPQYRIHGISLKGLRITFPPRQGDTQKVKREETAARQQAAKYPIFIEHIEANDAEIVLLRAQPDKKPLVLPLHQLEVTNMNFDRPAQFETELTNAIPRGEIHAKGTFGPWNADTPRALPVQGSYQFNDADLSTIKGLEGTLTSAGTFAGPLDYLEVKGDTETPDFTLRRVDNPVDLRTEFSATVDGTNGDTYLHSVEAHFLHSTLQVQGEVVDKYKNIRGRTINLDAYSDDARAEDLIRLAVKTDRPAVNGPAKLQAKIRIPEEDKDLSDRLDVTAQFTLAQGHFGNPEVQAKVDTLSRKGQGEPKDTEIAHVPSHLVAEMHWQRSVIQFSTLEFFVPGAQLDLQGSYALKGDLAFSGDLLLDAKLSQTTTGAKSFFLRAVDPFFRGKNGGARIPLKISGTKDHPHFGLGHVRRASKSAATNPQATKSD